MTDILRIKDQIGRPGKLSVTSLTVDDDQRFEGLPWLRAELSEAPAGPLTIEVRVHNSAGIPVISGRAMAEAGSRSVLFRELRAMGIDAYAHKPLAEREQIASRIWSRRTYATVIFDA